VISFRELNLVDKDNALKCEGVEVRTPNSLLINFSLIEKPMKIIVIKLIEKKCI